MDAISRARLSLDGLSVGDAFGERFFGPSSEVLHVCSPLPRLALQAKARTETGNIESYCCKDYVRSPI